VIELKAFMFKSLYVWMATHSSPLFSNFPEFLDLCSFSSPYLGVSHLYSLYTSVVPLSLSNLRI
jgi:hypothetical protein